MVAFSFLWPRNWGFFFLIIFISFSMEKAFAVEEILKPVTIEKGIHALVGSIGGRTYENHGLNANYGVIETQDGVILIDSGASYQGAAILDQEIKKLTTKKVRWVINTGSQDHRWLGNQYFSKQGAEIIVLNRTAITQASLGLSQMDSLKNSLKERMNGTEPMVSPKPINADYAKLNFGGVDLEIRYLNHAHFAGDVVVYLPQQKIMFSGDHIYIDRLLGILPQSNAETWLSAFKKIQAINPKVIVPGHGSITNMKTSSAHTGDYLEFVVNGVKKYAEDMAGVEAAVKNLSKAPAFEKLANFSELHLGNVSRAYLRFEAQ
jgi:glyoxylase-like metal-dependent hydrolase (beta-lactamase superfamily II)